MAWARDSSSLYSSSEYTSEASDSELVGLLNSANFSDLGLDDSALAERLSANTEPAEELEAVYLQQNLLTHLPARLQTFPALRVLDLSHNRLTHVDDAVLALPSLTSLVLKRNRLGDDALPKDFGLQKNLRELNLSGNSFSHIPEQVLELRCLADLYIAENQIQALPESIHRLRRLRVLHLGGNQLTSIPETLGNLFSLQVLLLCDNQLTELPASICRLPRLRTLLLHANHLSTLPGAIVRLRALKQLSLRDNPLVRNFVSAMQYEVPSLVELAARSVKLHSIPYGPGDLPQCLIQHLRTAKRCLNKHCKGVFFDTRVEEVQFVDFCGMFHIPLMRYLCSSHCERSAVVDRPRLTDDSDSDQEVERRQRRLRRVLLG